MEITRDLEVVGECPKCGVPGLHLMPGRVLQLKLSNAKLARARERYEYQSEAFNRHERNSWGGYGDPHSWRRSMLEEAREKYHAAQHEAQAHAYALKRECYSCSHTWHELLRLIISDDEVELLRKRYPEGLVFVPR
jgi:hypothetical protein